MTGRFHSGMANVPRADDRIKTLLIQTGSASIMWKQNGSPQIRRLSIIIAAVFLSFACDRESVDSPQIARTRGTILISIDTLRADHLEAYGYGRDTSPFLTKMAQRGVLFENAITPIPSTLPAHVSMLTGLHPKEHLVYPPDGVIPDSIEMLAEVFQGAGYTTAGFTDGGFMSGSYGFNRGFDEWNDNPQKNGVPYSRRIETTLEYGLNFLRSLEPNEPFFLFLHTYAVHDPYAPPEAYVGRYWSKPAPPDIWAPTGPNFGRFNCGHNTLSPAERDYFVSLYDAGIRYVDDSLATFFSDMASAGISEDEITVVLTADHGEEFLEHGYLSHEQAFHHNVHIPLVVLHPSLVPARIKTAVSITDITPTLLELAGIAWDETESGQSLVALADGITPEDEARRPLYVQSSTGGADSIYSYPTPSPELYQFVGSPLRSRWMTPRGVSFKASGPTFPLKARSHMEPRQLLVEIDGAFARKILIERVSSQSVQDPFQTVNLTIPDDGQEHVVRLSADSCAPVNDRQSPDCRCLALQLDGLPPSTTSLFEIQSDPNGERDLSGEKPELTSALSAETQRAKKAYRAAAEAQNRELSPETIQRLKSLGYL